MEELNTGPTTGEVNLALAPTMEDVGLLGENFLTFFDENSSVVFKGIIDQNGGFIIDPSQFVNILLDQPQHQAQTMLDTSNGMTIQMITMPHQFPVSGKSILNERIEDNVVDSQRQVSVSQTSCSQDNIHSDGKHSNTTKSDDLHLQENQIESQNSLMPKLHDITGDIETKKQRTKTKPVKISTDPVNIQDLPSNANGPFLCNICLKSFKAYQLFRKHKAEHLNEKPYHCKICLMQFNFEINFKLHTMVHDSEQSGNLQCQVCMAKFSRHASLKSHLRVHEKEENLVCNECGEEVPTVARLNEHMDEHRTRVQQCMVYRCKMCGKTFNSQALLRDHSKEHVAVRKELKAFARQKPRSKIKKQNANPNDTAKASLKKKKRVCTVCSKAFDKPSQLDRHFRIHSGEKPFKCSYTNCDKSFNQKVTLESHVLACHQGLKPFKCDLCSLCFSQRGNLKSHIIKVHISSGQNEKVFKCEECACVYRRLATLNNHIARVHAVASTDLPIHIQNTQLPVTVTAPANPEVPVISIPPPSLTNVPRTETTASNIESQSEATSTEETVTTNSITDNIAVPEAIVEEVNCVYDDSQGTSKRCLLKVKKIGLKKYHLCPVCPKSFRKPSDLIRHIRVHTLERPYVCGVCSKSFAVKSTLNTHMKTHDPFKQISCNVCQKKFSVLSSLKSHERLHTGAKPFQCMQCGKYFRTSSQRRVHTKTHARNALGMTGRRKLLRIGEAKVNLELPDPLKITSQGLIPVPNRAIKTLVNGALVDQRTRPYKCNQLGCIATFKKSSHLKQHQRSHTGERPYKCVQCHRNFISSGVLKNHIKTHQGIRDYSCNVCKASFTTNGSLTRHMATHMDERLYVCPYCAKTFKTSVATRKHIKVHRDEVIPFNSSVTIDDGNPSTETGILNDQFSQEIQDVSQQFSNVQEYDTSSLVNLYGNDFSDVNEVITGDLPVSVESNVLHRPDNHLNNIAPITCQSSELIQNPDGTVTLQYTLPSSSIGEGQVDSDNIELRMDQDNNFDPSIFTLQQGESLDLQFLQDSQEMSNIENSFNNLCAYEVSTQSSSDHITIPVEKSETLIAKTEVPSTITDSITPIQENSVKNIKKRIANSTNAAKSRMIATETKKIRDASRPISEQIYTELSTQPYQHRPKNLPGSSESLCRSANKLNECSICQTRFKKKSDLDRHMRIHTGEKPYRCGLCGKSFRVKSTREAHMRTHEEKKKTVSCHVCKNLFSTKSSLRVHLRLHLDLKPYQCPYPNCTRSFRTSGHRKSHVQTHFKQNKNLTLTASVTANPGEVNGCISDEPQTYILQQNPNQSQTILTQVLPPVETIKDIKSITAQPQLDLTGLHVIGTTNSHGIESQENIQVLNNMQLLDGLQFASLDLSSLQMDDSFLQNVTNVIFLPTNNQGTTELVNGTSNMVIGMLPSQDITSTNLLTGKDVTLSLNLVGSSQNQLTGQLVSDDNNLHQYIINQNEMMSSTARPSSSMQQQSYILSTSNDLVCQTCSTPFSTKKQLQKHEKTHKSLPTEKPFKCFLCPRRFVQQTSLDAHVQGHSKEKKEFLCPLCSFKTPRKPNLKTHFKRAHPDNWPEFNETVAGIPKISVSS